MKLPPARSRTRFSLIGVPLNAKSSTSLASGSLAMVQLVSDRARLLLGDLGLEQIADEALRFVLALDRTGERLVPEAPHAERA